MSEVCYRTLATAIPFTPQSAQLICDCLNHYLTHTGKPLATVERRLALYKLNSHEGWKRRINR